MRLDRVLATVDVLEWKGDPSSVEVAAVTYDSRRVVPGALFCALPGATHDGLAFVGGAVELGAVATLAEQLVPAGGLSRAVVQARVGSGQGRPAMARAAAAFFGHPSERLRVVGVTGTNGKTTVTHLLGAILDAAGCPAGVLGTLSGARTTPESPDLQAGLAAMVADGKRAAAIEVSSHALVQHRADAMRFAVSVFTNLSPEHLDFHPSMEHYFRAKAMLFDPERSERAVVNGDDPYGQRLLRELRIPATPYRLSDAAVETSGPTGTRFRWDGETMQVRLAGLHNLSNALAAATAARELGATAADVAAGLATVASVPGRFERIDEGQEFTVLVDYAHTPDGLDRALVAARSLAMGHRVAVVFGCGGDRDRSKRPLMGAVATRLADHVVVTSDNPRSEDPAAIIAEIVGGAGAGHGADTLVIEPDRRAAIRTAVDWARAGDVVLVAGKGHETGQIVGGTVSPFDDRIEAAGAVRARGGRL